MTQTRRNSACRGSARSRSACATSSARSPGLAFFDCNGVRLLLDKPQDAAFDHPASVIYYSVPETRATHETLLARGVGFLREPHVIAKLGAVEVWMAFFRDPDENVLALMSEAPASA